MFFSPHHYLFLPAHTFCRFFGIQIYVVINFYLAYFADLNQFIVMTFKMEFAAGIHASFFIIRRKKRDFFARTELPHLLNHPNTKSLMWIHRSASGNGNAVSPPRTSESAVTTSETTAMVAAAAAAGYLAMQKHGQHHQHGTTVRGSSPMTSLSTSALPPASAAAVAAAAAATALATTQHHQQRHASVNSHERSVYYQIPQSVDFNLPSLVNHSAKSASFVNTDVIKKPVNSHAPFSQHSQQQQDANTAAAVAAAACFGAILSQPVAAAAAASHAAVSKPTAGDILSQTVSGDCALSSMPAPPTVIVPQPSASGVTPPAPPAPPPPTAVAAAAAAAVAAAVVSSAGPSAAVAAISAAHLATSSLSHAHSATRVSCAPPDTSLALTASGSPYVTNMKPSGVVDPLGVGVRHRRVCNSNETRVDVYGTDETMPLHLNVPPSPPPPPSAIPSISAAAAANPSPLGSSAATAAYTATMTTAAAAAAMAAAVAVEEHNQKKNAAAAAMAAFSESAALAQEVQNMARIADHASLSPGSLPSSSLTTTTKSSSDIPTVYPLPTGKPVPHRRLRLPRNRHQAHFSAFDVVDDESYEESYDEDEDEGDETSSTVLDPHQNDRKYSRLGRSCSPDRIFGRSQPLVDKPRQRSLSYPTCTVPLGSDASKEPMKRPACVSNSSLVLLSPQALSINSATGPPRVYRECGLPPKRPKLVAPRDGDHVVSSNSTYIRRRYHHFPRRVRQIDMESEMDEVEELCYTEDAEFYSPTAVVTQPSYRERLHVLKCENFCEQKKSKYVFQRHFCEVSSLLPCSRSKTKAPAVTLPFPATNILDTQPQKINASKLVCVGEVNISEPNLSNVYIFALIVNTSNCPIPTHAPDVILKK
ncbi:hypothetical protein TSMEX_010715 [Taenia solium]|eukprot:TsM_000199000 transcript=TsM_000199000 gene=TsM_000199000